APSATVAVALSQWARGTTPALGDVKNHTFAAVGVRASGGLTRKPMVRRLCHPCPWLNARQGVWLKTPIWISSPVKFARAPCQFPICPPPPLTPEASPCVSTYQQKKQ